MPQPPSPPIKIEPATIIRLFHRLYYSMGAAHRKGTWDNTFWMGVKTEKCPLDLWVYQEILFGLKPELIIETGTRHGGSAMFLSSMCDLLNVGQVVTIDIRQPDPAPPHPRLTYLHGSSTDPEIVGKVRAMAEGKSRVMVILDSDHRAEHVLEELRTYHPLVSPGSYLIVEDTNINGHPVLPNFGPGPMEALMQFLQENPDFEQDARGERHLLTFNPAGYLRRKAGDFR